MQNDKGMGEKGKKGESNQAYSSGLLSHYNSTMLSRLTD